jgi:hypothetical protein
MNCESDIFIVVMRLRVYENRALRRICRPKEGGSEGRRLHNEELHNSYASPNVIRVIKSRTMGLAGHVERTGRWEMHIKLLLKILKGRYDTEDLDVDG